MSTVTFWFEFASTYSYPAAMRFEAAAREAGVEARWRPFLLGPIFAAQGWDNSPFNLYPAKGRYMWRDMARICAAEGLALTRPERFPANGLLAARVATAGAEAEWLPAFVRAVYHAEFAEGRDISAPETVAAALAEAGAPVEALEAAALPQTKSALRAATEEAQSLGIFGAPSFTVEGELFWGHDRLEAALAWARGEAALPPATA